jgi:hypothetical protein
VKYVTLSKCTFVYITKNDFDKTLEGVREKIALKMLRSTAYF